MEYLRIEILNPKVKAILKNLAALKLIKIQTPEQELKNILQSLRTDTPPAEIDITKEVETVRKARYENNQNHS